jgi:hypothetical protein
LPVPNVTPCNFTYSFSFRCALLATQLCLALQRTPATAAPGTTRRSSARCRYDARDILGREHRSACSIVIHSWHLVVSVRSRLVVHRCLLPPPTPRVPSPTSTSRLRYVGSIHANTLHGSMYPVAGKRHQQFGEHVQSVVGGGGPQRQRS